MLSKSWYIAALLLQNRSILIGSRFRIAGFRRIRATRLSNKYRNNFENLSLELRIVADNVSGGTQFSTLLILAAEDVVLAI